MSCQAREEGGRGEGREACDHAGRGGGAPASWRVLRYALPRYALLCLPDGALVDVELVHGGDRQRELDNARVLHAARERSAPEGCAGSDAHGRGGWPAVRLCVRRAMFHTRTRPS